MSNLGCKRKRMFATQQALGYLIIFLKQVEKGFTVESYGCPFMRAAF